MCQQLSRAEQRAEQRAMQRDLDQSQRNLASAEKRRIAAINRALNHPMPMNKRQRRAAERAFAYPVR